MQDADTDEELMLRVARNKDGDAFKRLVHKHVAGLKKFLYFMCRNDADAEDMTQEVWMKLMRSASSYQPTASFRTYLFQIARNHFTDEYRKSHRQLETVSLQDESFSESVQQMASGDDPVPQAENLQKMELLHAGLQSLPVPQREALLLRLEGYSVPEIAQITGRNEEAVKSQIRYAQETVSTRIARMMVTP